MTLINQKSTIHNPQSTINVAIIGSGTMGSGIAQVAATAGCMVKLFDLNATALEKSQMALELTLQKLVEKEKITADEKSSILANISYVTE